MQYFFRGLVEGGHLAALGERIRYADVLYQPQAAVFQKPKPASLAFINRTSSSSVDNTWFPDAELSQWMK